MALIQNVNVSSPNDNLGDALRSGFVKVNENFSEINNKKVEKVSGKGLSSNDFTTAEKNKLTGIEAEAQKNVQANYNQNDSTQPDYIIGKPSDGKILVFGDYSLSGQNLTIKKGWVWQLNNFTYTNTVDIVINFPYSVTGNQRLDLIVFNTSNTAQRVEGEESTSNPLTPQTPENTVLFSITLITDGSIANTVPIVNRDLFSIDFVVAVTGTQTFSIPTGTTAKQVFNNGTQHWKSTTNNASRVDTWTQTDNIVTLNKPTTANNYIVIFYQ